MNSRVEKDGMFPGCRINGINFSGFKPIATLTGESKVFHIIGTALTFWNDVFH